MGKNPEIVKKISRVVDFIQIAGVYVSMLFLVAMTIIISVNVVLRYGFNSGLQWAEEIAKVLVVWFTFLALALGVKQNLHISIQVLPRSLPRWVNRILDILKDSVILIVGVIMIIYGWDLVQFSSRSIMPATGLPGSFLYIVMPIAGVIIVIESLMDLFQVHSSLENFDTLMGKGDEDA